MTVDQILSKIRYKYEKIHQPPKASMMKSVAQECSRKIGSWRKALWLAGALENQRQKSLPQLEFEFTINDWQITAHADKSLKKLMVNNPNQKPRLK